MKNRWKRERERGPEPFGLGFSDLCLRPRPLFVPPPAKKRRNKTGTEGARRGTNEATRTESVDTTGIRTYVPDLSRKSHAGKTLPFQPRPPPSKIGRTIHTPFLPAFVRLLAFSRPIRGPEEREGGDLSHDRPVSLLGGRGGGRYGLIRFWTRVFFNRRLIVDQTLLNRRKRIPHTNFS